MTAEPGVTLSPDRVADTFAIQNILYLHSRGLDRLDSTAIQSAYWPDAEVAG